MKSSHVIYKEVINTPLSLGTWINCTQVMICYLALKLGKMRLMFLLGGLINDLLVDPTWQLIIFFRGIQTLTTFWILWEAAILI